MNDLYKVVVTDFITEPFDHEQEVLGDLAEVSGIDARTESDLIGKIEGADAIVIYHSLKISQNVIDLLENCKVIVACGVGYDNVDHMYAQQCGIPVVNVPDYGTEEVADSAIGMMLSMVRGITFLNSRLRDHDGAWVHNHVIPLHRLRGSVLGIVGLGRIGTAVALRGKAMGMDVVFYDPYVPDGRDKSMGIRRAETLDELLEQAYVISTHCPLTEETYKIIDDGAIAKMQRGSYVVNTSRGAVVDTDAVFHAITSGQLQGAAIDVLETEPPKEDDLLIQAWRNPSHPAHHRVLINPHAAFYSEQSAMDMRTKGAQACRNALLDLPLRNIVNGVTGANA